MLRTPRPYGQATLDNSPLRTDGSDFPCKMRPDAFQYNKGEVNETPLGSKQQLSFVGSAVHGGGSCQLSVTYDYPPRGSSTFKVILSIEGGCPAQVPGNLPPDPRGTGASTFKYTIPADLPVGPATLVWTWFNRVGNREMYMNCAPILISGTGSSIESAQSSFQNLPDIFIANIANGCTTPESSDLAFPNPGPTVNRNGSGPLSKPAGNCAMWRTNQTSTHTPQDFSSFAANDSDPTKQPKCSSAGADAAPVRPAPTSRCGLDQNGMTFCKGNASIGICNFGEIMWRRVSAGTICVDGFLQAALGHTESLPSRPTRSRLRY